MSSQGQAYFVDLSDYELLAASETESVSLSDQDLETLSNSQSAKDDPDFEPTSSLDSQSTSGSLQSQVINLKLIFMSNVDI